MVAKFVWEVPARIVLPLDGLLARGRMLVTRAGPRPGQPQLALVNLATGETMWAVDLPSDIQALHTTDDALVTAIGDKVLGLAHADGNTLWEQPLKGMLDRGWTTTPFFQQIQWFRDLGAATDGVGGAFLARNDRVLAKVGTVVYSLDARTGQVHWEQEVGFSLGFPLTAAGDRVLAATSDNGLIALNSDTGDVEWARAELARVSPIYVLGDDLYCADTQVHYRLDPDTGETLWTAKVPSGMGERLYRVEDRLVLQRPHDISVIVRDTGEVAGTAQTAPQASAVGRDCVFYHAPQGDLYCTSVANVETKWHQPPTGAGAGRMFVAGDVLVTLAPGLVQAFSAETGKSLWARKAGPGRLWDTSTWASDDRTAYVHDADMLCGYALHGGAHVVQMQGRFFFVHYMRVMNDTLYLHSGKPAEESIGAAPLKGGEG